MARYLVIGDPVVTLGDEAFIPDGALIVEGRSITEVGPREALEAMGPFDRTIGSTDHVIMPGFINCHFHSGGALNRGMAQYIFERANVHVHSMWSGLSEEELYHAVLWSLITNVRGGQTALLDFNYGRPRIPSFGYAAILQAFEDLGIRGAVGLVTRDRNTLVHADDEAFLRQLPPDLADRVRSSSMGYSWPVEDVFSTYRQLVPDWDGRDGRLRLLLAPDWTPPCSDELYVRNRRMADEFGTGITTHVLETKSEMMFNLEAHGKTAMRRLADLGVLGPDVSCAHFVWATDEDITILADTGAVAVNNPGSNLRLATGIARVRDIMARGGRVAFGTDNISFSERGDFFQELRLAAYLQRTPGALEEGRMDSADILRAAATNGAQAIRFERELGSLSEGKDADLVLLRRHRLFWPEEKFRRTPPLDVILDRAAATDVESVMVAGRLVLDEGRITTVDEVAVRHAIEDAADRLLGPEGVDPDAVSLGREVEPYVFDFYRPWTSRPVTPASVYNAVTPPAQPR